MDIDAAHRFRRQLMALHRRLRSQHAGTRPLNDVLVLGSIDRLGEAASSPKIAADLHMQRTNVATQLGRLERDGLVTRSTDPGDRRRSHIALTDAGRELLQTDRQRRGTWLIEATRANLTDSEINVLLAAGELMDRLADHADQTTTDKESNP